MICIVKDNKIANCTDTDLMMESQMINDSFKQNDYFQIQNEIMGDYQHHVSIDEPGNEISGYVALEGRSLFAGDLDDSVRRVVKHSKNSVFKLSSSSDAKLIDYDLLQELTIRK